jgi:hypothetical protein
MFGRCATESKTSWVYGQASASSLEAFVHLRDACQKPNSKRAANESRTMSVAEASAHFADVLNETNTSLLQTLGRLQALPAPGTITDAEFQAWLISSYETRLRFLDGAQAAFNAFRLNQGQFYNSGNLQSALWDLYDILTQSEALRFFVDNYAWQPGACSLPTFAEANQDAHALYGKALALAIQYGKPADAAFVSNPYGGLIKVDQRKLENLTRERLVLGLIGLQSHLRFELSYWDNVTRPVLPTREEGRWLVANYVAGGQTLWNEYYWRNEQAALNETDHWTADSAARTLALQGIVWPFAGMECQPP